MTKKNNTLRKLRFLNDEVSSLDPELKEEFQGGDPDRYQERMNETMRPEEEDIGLESIVLRRFRPVLRVIDGTAELRFDEQSDSKLWRDRLSRASPQLDAAIAATGRINLENGSMAWVGTGWLVRDDMIVTNRHVADVFVAQDGQGFNFIAGSDGPLGPDIDFLQEFDNKQQNVFRLKRPIYVVPRPGPDIAFFEVERGGDGLASPITLAKTPRTTTQAAVIGYPAFDSRIPEIDLMERIYGKAYNKKRLAPGGVTKLDELLLQHDCTTLGGNSGSAVVDIQSGEALGLHFSGAFLRSNYAVRADIVARALEDVLGGHRPYAEAQFTKNQTRASSRIKSQTQSQNNATVDGTVAGSDGGITITVPLKISISVDQKSLPGMVSVTPAVLKPSTLVKSLTEADDDIDLEEEGCVEELLGREGFKSDFLKHGAVETPLPRVTRKSNDVLSFKFNGKTETELRYQHFSVVMNASRRMCFYSAVNIDGARALPADRKRWRTDPRIPGDRQIIKECYGNPPKFSRGHMTRRNDPSWGTRETAERANNDTMYVTNAAPQMQAFNAPIWLELEDYALENAIEDGMRISVYTGPFFRDDDPVHFGVAIPISFWKIIAFVHDDTGELTATGYRMNQEAAMPSQDEFVFGAFTSSHLGVAAQVAISSIETEAGLDFGDLAEHDPLSTQEIPGGPPAMLLSTRQIRFY